jgi:hypothetical protein
MMLARLTVYEDLDMEIGVTLLPKGGGMLQYLYEIPDGGMVPQVGDEVGAENAGGRIFVVSSRMLNIGAYTIAPGGKYRIHGWSITAREE